MINFSRCLQYLRLFLDSDISSDRYVASWCGQRWFITANSVLTSHEVWQLPHVHQWSEHYHFHGVGDRYSFWDCWPKCRSFIVQMKSMRLKVGKGLLRGHDARVGGADGAEERPLPWNHLITLVLHSCNSSRNCWKWGKCAIKLIWKRPH